MVKKCLCVLLCFAILIPLSGCWSYRGLNEITIVSGVAIDFDPDSGVYSLTCEVVDAASPQQQPSSKLVESKGATIFDAVRNAKKRLINKLYWANTQVLIIGSEVAKHGDGLSNIINWYLSDAECRETTNVIVSEEKLARDLIKIHGLDNTIVSYEIKKIIDNDQSLTSSVYNLPLYRVYSTLKTPGLSLTLPVFHVAQNDDKQVVEANGEAVFQNEKMIGTLNPEDTKYFLFTVNGVHGGILTLYSSDEKKRDISMEISENKTKTAYNYTNNEIGIKIETDTEVFLDGVRSGVDLLDEETEKKIESRTEEMIENRIKYVIQKVQKEYDSDIFGFGNLIYKKDPALWKKLEPDWDKKFKTLKVDVKSKVTVLNTSFTKRT